MNKHLASLTRIDTASLCDADKTLRVLDSGMRSVSAFTHMAGTARIVQCRGDFLAVMEGLQEAQAGEVLVVDADSGPRAVAGELFATEAARKGLAGMVIDGACRDASALAAMKLPFYARSISPMAGTAQLPGKKKTSVVCGGVVIHNGDWLVGDRDGIVVVAAEALEELLKKAEAIKAAEAKILQQMAGGKSLFDLLTLNEHAEARRTGQPSKLRLKVEEA